jgi:hypothetical protein
MTNIIVLSFLLIAAFVFVILPMKFFVSSTKKTIELKEMQTSEISSIIMFVSKLKKDKQFQDLLAYKILSHMKKNTKFKSACLIHSGISKDDGSSYENAYKLHAEFNDEKFLITTLPISDIFDIEESFNAVNKILLSDDIPTKDIICDFTSGTKPMSLGMTVACIGEKRLVYFPGEDATKYLHINPGELMGIV